MKTPRSAAGAAGCMEAIGGLPEFLEQVYQIQDQGDVEFLVDAARGVLEEGPAAASVPAEYHGRASPAECLVHPSGRFVYESNRGHNSIAAFQVNPDTAH